MGLKRAIKRPKQITITKREKNVKICENWENCKPVRKPGEGNEKQGSPGKIPLIKNLSFLVFVLFNKKNTVVTSH